jgi:hypothetical protein
MMQTGFRSIRVGRPTAHRRSWQGFSGGHVGRNAPLRRLILIAMLLLGITAWPAAGGDRPDAIEKLDGQSRTDAPMAMVPEATFSFGTVIEGTIIEHAYVIQNQGRAALKIIAVETGCGCTEALPPDTIEAGSSGELVVHGDTSGYGGQMFDTTLTVSTNDPAQPDIRLTLTGWVEPFARIEPTHITLEGRPGDAVTARAVITPNPAYPFRITAVRPDERLGGNVAVRLDRQRERYVVMVRNRQPHAGQYRGRIILDTDSSLKPHLIVYVIGRITT